MYGASENTVENENENLLCLVCSDHIDDEENLFNCIQLGASQNVKFDDIYSNDMNIVAITVGTMST